MARSVQRVCGPSFCRFPVRLSVDSDQDPRSLASRLVGSAEDLFPQRDRHLIEVLRTLDLNAALRGMTGPPSLAVTVTGQRLTIAAVHDAPNLLGQRFRGAIEPNGTGSRITGRIGSRWWGRAHFAFVQTFATFFFVVSCLLLARAPRPLEEFGPVTGISSLIFVGSWVVFYVHWRAAARERSAILTVIERAR